MPFPRRKRRPPIRPRTPRLARKQPWGGRKLQSIRTRDWWAWYSLYLASAAWKRKRARIIRERERTCAKCGWVAPLQYTHLLQLHHTTYQRVGRERDEDLELLCDKCHDKLHPMRGLLGTGERR
jgi:hypothetical protein